MKLPEYCPIPVWIQIVLLIFVVFAMGCNHPRATVEPTGEHNEIATAHPEPTSSAMPHNFDRRIIKATGWFRFLRASYIEKQPSRSNDKWDRITVSRFTPKKNLRAGLACPLDVNPRFLTFCERPQIFGPETLVTEITVSEVDNIPFSLMLNLAQGSADATGSTILVRIRDDDGDGVFESLLTGAVDERLAHPEWVQKRLTSMKDQ